MPLTYKVLGQIVPATSGALNVLYQVPAATQAVCSTLSICNLSQSAVYRVAVQPASASILGKHYVCYDAPVGASDTIFLTLGVALSATDVVAVQASHASCSFNLFGSEIS